MIHRKVKLIVRELNESDECFENRVNKFLENIEAHFVKKIEMKPDFCSIEYLH